MPKLLNILATVLVLISVSSNIISEAVASTSINTSSSSQLSSLQSSSINSSSSMISSTSSIASINSSAISSLSSIQNTLAEKLPNGKKQLKKKLSLEYTSPKFESELTDQQKSAILTSLKKWKLDLPINNAFTVTSIADLTSNNRNQISSSTSSAISVISSNGIDKSTNKKSNNSIVSSSVRPAKKPIEQKVVYMWASTPDPNWDKNKPFNAENYESGDPRFIRTEFNVLLKKSKNGNWKATLEQDNELKAELQDIPEAEVTTEEKNVLFGANKTENNYTDKVEVLLESANLGSNISSTDTSNSTTNSANSTSNQSTVPNSQQATSSSNSTIGLMDIFFKSPKVSAAAWEDEYSWPWKNGETWTVNTGYGWHECSTPNETNYAYSEGITVSGCAFDMYPNASASSEVLAPKSGIIRRACKDEYQGFVRIGELSILHLNLSGLIEDNVSVSKSQKIGTMFYPPAYNFDLNGDGVKDIFSSRCGKTTAGHLHIKFAVDNMNVDGIIIKHNGLLPSSLTSKNEKPPVVRPQIVDYSMSRVQPPLDNWDRALDSSCSLNSIVTIWKRNDGDCQKLKYDYGTNAIRNPFGQCLDAGNMNGNGKLVFYSCNNSSNQKWFHEPGDGRIWVQQKDNSNKNRCIEYSALNNGDEIYVLPCSSDGRQRWFIFDLAITQAAVPSEQPTVFNNYNGLIWYDSDWNKVFDVNGANPTNGTPVKLWDRNSGAAQRWGFDSNTREIKGMNNKCLDAGDVNNPNNRWLRINDCHGGSNQKWFRDTINRIHSEAKTSLCVDSPSNNTTGSQLYLYPCHNWNNQKFSTDNMSISTVETFQKLSLNYDSRFGFDIYNGNINNNPIKAHWYWGGWNEKFEYNSTTQEIRNISGKCVDAGDINNSSNRWIRINDCHNGNNQKWYADMWGRIHSVANTNLCVDSWWWNADGSPINMENCGGSPSQAWTWNYLN
jgi:Ricin-type beta-trefoil lectin domain